MDKETGDDADVVNNPIDTEAVPELTPEEKMEALLNILEVNVNEILHSSNSSRDKQRALKKVAQQFKQIVDKADIFESNGVRALTCKMCWANYDKCKPAGSLACRKTLWSCLETCT